MRLSRQPVSRAQAWPHGRAPGITTASFPPAGRVAPVVQASSHLTRGALLRDGQLSLPVCLFPRFVFTSARHFLSHRIMHSLPTQLLVCVPLSTTLQGTVRPLLPRLRNLHLRPRLRRPLRQHLRLHHPRLLSPISALPPSPVASTAALLPNLAPTPALHPRLQVSCKCSTYIFGNSRASCAHQFNGSAHLIVAPSPLPH